MTGRGAVVLSGVVRLPAWSSPLSWTLLFLPLPVDAGTFLLATLAGPLPLSRPLLPAAPFGDEPRPECEDLLDGMASAEETRLR